jgi:hypothetical protein
MSAIMLVNNTYDDVRLVMGYLQAQTRAKEIEMVFVVPSSSKLGLDEKEMRAFHSWQVVEVGKIKSIARGYADGIRKARAPVITLTQDHAFPDSRWAECFLDAHQNSWAAVGPKVGNGNPGTMVSWADFYISYGEWAHPVSSGNIRHLPGHNSSYKQDVLLKHEPMLEDMLEAESVFHRQLKAQGYKLFLESNTTLLHLNHAKWTAWIPKRFFQGRQFAATWAKKWTWHRKLFYAILSPLIPCLRFWRVQKHIRRGQKLSFLIRLMPTLMAGLIAEGIGHLVGYIAGPGNCMEKLTMFEFNRVKETQLREV